MKFKCLEEQTSDGATLKDCHNEKFLKRLMMKDIDENCHRTVRAKIMKKKCPLTVLNLEVSIIVSKSRSVSFSTLPSLVQGFLYWMQQETKRHRMSLKISFVGSND